MEKKIIFIKQFKNINLKNSKEKFAFITMSVIFIAVVVYVCE